MSVQNPVLAKEVLIPVGTVALLAGIIWNIAIQWPSTKDLERRVSNSENRITTLETTQASVNERMARIETKLDILIDQLKKSNLLLLNQPKR